MVEIDCSHSVFILRGFCFKASIGSAERSTRMTCLSKSTNTTMLKKKKLTSEGCNFKSLTYSA